MYPHLTIERLSVALLVCLFAVMAAVAPVSAADELKCEPSLAFQFGTMSPCSSFEHYQCGYAEQGAKLRDQPFTPSPECVAIKAQCDAANAWKAKNDEACATLNRVQAIKWLCTPKTKEKCDQSELFAAGVCQSGDRRSMVDLATCQILLENARICYATMSGCKPVTYRGYALLAAPDPIGQDPGTWSIGIYAAGSGVAEPPAIQQVVTLADKDQAIAEAKKRVDQLLSGGGGSSR
jgi:hypothetical protein